MYCCSTRFVVLAYCRSLDHPSVHVIRGDGGYIYVRACLRLPHSPASFPHLGLTLNSASAAPSIFLRFPTLVYSYAFVRCIRLSLFPPTWVYSVPSSAASACLHFPPPGS
ncbi:unnamed protein product [Ectocarpus sp. 8 AP-2014]